MTGYILKQVPEDFVVKEIPLRAPQEEGESAYFLLKKRDFTTQDAIHRVASILGRHHRDIGFAGTKDRVAVTEQLISIKGISKDAMIAEKDLTLTYHGRGPHLRLGDLQGNSFTITVRNIDRPPKPLPRFLNLFGEQRFSGNNHIIGRLIVKKRFREAVDEMLKGSGRWEERMKAYLEEKPTDFVGAIRTVPRPLGIMFVHAYQSLLWNTIATSISAKQKDDIMVPVIGFGTDLSGSPFADQVRAIMAEEDISTRDFIIRAIPGFTFEGGERSLFAEIQALSIGDLEIDELNPGKKKCALSFSLSKGCYATEAVKAMLT